MLGALCAALGALAAALPEALHRHVGVTRIDALRGMFVVYAALGLAVGWLYGRLPATPQAPVGPSIILAAWRPRP